ncbi:MAG TPA: sugar phosphate isomerase/epimerase [Opitutaceae bacterium]|nr:sugar phosphate isomerase/epimerase [Opitutaceae bacterium]
MHFPSPLPIGTLAGKGPRTAEYIKAILPHGFESFQIHFGQDLKGADLGKVAREVREVLSGSEAKISSLAIYANPLGATETDENVRKIWEQCIDHAHDFGCDLVCGFTGRVVDKPIPESLPRFKEVFGPLAKRAADRGVRIAFENCPMGGSWQTGNWNIAHNPAAWELMFDALPDANLGLEWEPCHQLCQLIEPLPQLRRWVPKIFHIHGKDATIHWDVVRTEGIVGKNRFAWHRTPGFGDTNWTEIISELRRHGYRGAIDIEGWHDPVYRDDLEMTGQVHALNYLKQCRAAFVPNPVGFERK